ncbi:MAG: hypothetical protein VW930_06005, partial [Burkholderiaceae bacterium]
PGTFSTLNLSPGRTLYCFPPDLTIAYIPTLVKIDQHLMIYLILHKGQDLCNHKLLVFLE